MAVNEKFRNKNDQEYDDCMADICGDLESTNTVKFNKIRCDALGGMLEDCHEENFPVEWRKQHGCGMFLLIVISFFDSSKFESSEVKLYWSKGSFAGT